MINHFFDEENVEVKLCWAAVAWRRSNISIRFTENDFLKLHPKLHFILLKRPGRSFVRNQLKLWTVTETWIMFVTRDT